jgi:preprotein translocase subunit SecD
VLAALIVVLFLAIVGGDLANPGNWSKDFQVRLGLDLTSGTTVALQAVKPGGGTPSANDMKLATEIMISRVNATGVTEAQVEQQGADIINISVPGRSSQAVIGLVSRTAELQFRQVLLVMPNTLVASPSSLPSPSPSAAPSGTSSPGAAPSPSGQAAGSPGAAGAGGAQETATRARALTAASASPSPSPSGTATPASSAAPSSAPASRTSTWQQAAGDPALGDPTAMTARTKVLFNKLNCADKNWQRAIGYTSAQWNIQDSQIVSCGRVNGIAYKYALDKAKVAGKMVASASATPQNTSVDWQVNLNFRSDGTKAFGDLTTQMAGQYHGSHTLARNQLAVVLDGFVVSSPYIDTSIPGGQAQITGSFTQAEATQLATQLSYGALPLSFEQKSIQTTSPQLGRDQLNAGLIAAALGLLLVVLYLLLYYRALALVAVSSLVIAALLAYLSVVVLGKYQHFALSLAGIAGLIVAIGITADSFIVFFERLRDEVREGRSLRAAVERGWGRARRTILVSDTVSFLAAALLYYFAIGSVRGFAFTLGLTTIIDVVVVFTFTKPVMTLLARTKFYGRGHPLSGLDPARLGARAPWRGSPRAATGGPARRTPVKEA